MSFELLYHVILLEGPQGTVHLGRHSHYMFFFLSVCRCILTIISTVTLTHYVMYDYAFAAFCVFLYRIFSMNHAPDASLL